MEPVWEVVSTAVGGVMGFQGPVVRVGYGVSSALQPSGSESTEWTMMDWSFFGAVTCSLLL